MQRLANIHKRTDKISACLSAMQLPTKEALGSWSLLMTTNYVWPIHMVLTKHPGDGRGTLRMASIKIGSITYC